MENLKIKVKSKSESKEAQELLDALGYSKDAFENKSTPCWIAICNGLTYSDYNIGKSVWYTACPKEISIQELRDMANQDQDEPFLTPETTLNDQYAEIEQVRQSGMKFDGNKPRYSLLPKGAVNSVIEVLEFGAKKYSADNWREVDNAKERYYNAAMRHIDLWWNGEKLDSETNVHHLAHAATNLFFLMWFDNK